MVTITFKKMKLLKDQNTVKIVGDCFGHEVLIEISILQLAKIFGTDREVVQEAEDDFGSKEYEDKCNETREYVQKFPEIDVWNKELEFSYVSVENEGWARRSTNPETIRIYAEDIVGWNNEGIRIEFPKEIFNQKLKDKKFRVFMSSFAVELRTDQD